MSGDAGAVAQAPAAYAVVNCYGYECARFNDPEQAQSVADRCSEHGSTMREWTPYRIVEVRPDSPRLQGDGPSGPACGIRFVRADVLCGRTSFDLVDRHGRHRGLIRYFDKATAALVGHASEGAHWALLHASGRIDRYDTLREARMEAIKTYG